MALSLLIIFFSYTPAKRYSLTYLRAAFNPFLEITNLAGHNFSNFIALYLGRKDLAADNQQLRQKIIELYKQNTKLKILQQENKILKKELQFGDSYHYRHLVARIIGRGPDFFSTQLIINKGSLDGLRPGLPVTAEQGILIGQISQVEPHLSFLKLLVNNQSKFSVNVMGEKPALGFLHGDHDLNLKIELLPKDIQLHTGDLVVTSGMDSYIPSGLLIGKIYSLTSPQKKLWQEAYVEPLLDYQSVRLVDIILPDFD